MTEARALALRLAPVVGEIMAEGHTSVCAVKEALNARGVPSREGGRWHLRSTHALLKRLRYTAIAEGKLKRRKRAMTDSTSNIEAVARDICSKQLSHAGFGGADLAADVDRYWHCVAAELEAGQIDEAGNPGKHCRLEEGLAAYRDWCQRHPESMGA